MMAKISESIVNAMWHLEEMNAAEGTHKLMPVTTNCNSPDRIIHPLDIHTQFKFNSKIQIMSHNIWILQHVCDIIWMFDLIQIVC